jgi:hypothetical protein
MFMHIVPDVDGSQCGEMHAEQRKPLLRWDVSNIHL